jgi:hypothetical protein
MARRFTSIQRMNVVDPVQQFINAPDPIYGTGVNGDVTLDGTTTVLGMVPSSNKYTMTSDLYFNNLTINNSVHLQPNGYRIFVKNNLTLGNGSRIGFTNGFATAGSIAQGGGIATAVTNSLGGSSATLTAIEPLAALGGAEYYKVPHQAVKGWSVTASSTTPTFLRGGAGGVGQLGGGVVIITARYIYVSSGTAYISAPGTPPAGGGVILLVSTYASLPTGVETDVTGASSGTFNYMQVV